MKQILKILCFNWRDLRNPYGGGAEVYLHEILKRIVRAGHSVTLFTSSFAGSEKSEVIDGIYIIRDGGKYSVYNKAKEFYNLNGAGYDIVIDSINTKPFGTPGFVKNKPILAIVYQLAKEYWFYETKFPINVLGRYILENYWLKKYKYIPTVTISDSSLKDLENLGFEKIFVVPVGLSIPRLNDIPIKESSPTLIFIGRLRKIKFPDHAIDAIATVRKKIPDAQLWIVGDGPIRKRLEKEAPDGVRFFGRVSQTEKIDLIRRAHVSVVPSIREGWGLVVTEANALGTPAVGYDVPGIRDAIINNQTGLLVSRHNKDELAKAIVRILNDSELRENLARASLTYSSTFDWDKSASSFLNILNDAVTQSDSPQIGIQRK